MEGLGHAVIRDKLSKFILGAKGDKGTKMLERLIILLMFLHCVVCATAAQRSWTSIDGRTITAEIRAADESQVVLWREDVYRTVSIPLNSLSEPDRGYVAGWLEGKATVTEEAREPEIALEEPRQAEQSLNFKEPRWGTSIADNREALLEGYFQAIRDLPLNWGNVGSVLEAVAVLKLQEAYPEPEYAIYSGIEYANNAGRTLGELDVLIWDALADKALAVYECKLTSNFQRAGAKAEEQLERFQDALKSKEIKIMHSRYNKTFKPEQFKQVAIFGIIGPHGANRAGWDLQIDISREEGDLLQERITGSN